MGKQTNRKAEAVGLERLSQVLLECAIKKFEQETASSEEGSGGATRKRLAPDQLLMAVDHCFALKGQGTVMTGTVLQGSISVNQKIEIPSCSVEKKVKSIQMFHKSVTNAFKGDRIGICVTQFDPKNIERSVICSPGMVVWMSSAIVQLHKIKFFKQPICHGQTFHSLFLFFLSF